LSCPVRLEAYTRELADRCDSECIMSVIKMCDSGHSRAAAGSETIPSVGFRENPRIPPLLLEDYSMF
jgi:hypothetical protein